jgi:hypothetical protein
MHVFVYTSLIPLVYLLQYILPITSYKDNDIKRVSHWSSKTLYVVGAVKGLHGNIWTKVKRNLDTLQSLWSDCRFIVYGDSKSLAVISNTSANAGQYTLIPESLSLPSHRTERLCSIRNLLLDRVRKLIAHNKHSYRNTLLVLIDLDSMNQFPFHSDVIQSAMELSSQWDVVTFNRPFYYDIWALRYPQYNVNVWDGRPADDTWKMIAVMRADIQTRLRDTELYPVYSAFNGFAIYKFKYTEGCTYHLTHDTDMEHIQFHDCLRLNGARIRVYNRSIIDEIHFGHPPDDVTMLD